ncbi:MAG: hypothetical protein JRG96_01420, partial [Deltaproteobacteria bacterium]|nr:hypothetical protein [Deltaproteobacteria bacterium]
MSRGCGRSTDAVVGFLLLEAYTRGGRLYVDAALGLALFSFVATVMLTY